MKAFICLLMLAVNACGRYEPAKPCGTYEQEHGITEAKQAEIDAYMNGIAQKRAMRAENWR